MTIAGFEDFQRSTVAKAALRSIATATVVLVFYYVVPLEHRTRQSVVLRVGVALALFVAVLVFEIGAIQKHKQPMLRAVVATATIIPLFLVLFAWIYLTMSRTDPAFYSIRLTRTSALYFAVTVFSTVGFGDIVPRTDVARIVTMLQMIADLIVIGVVVRLILGTATRAMTRQREQPK